MSSSEKINVTLTDISGVNMKLLNVYNMALCTDPPDGANKQYVDSVLNTNFSNIGIGANFYQSTQGSTVLFRSASTTILTSFDNTNIYLNTNMFYMPYPKNTVSTVSVQFFADAAVLAPNGKIYCPPYKDNYSVIIDPVNFTIDTTSMPLTIFSSPAFSSAALAKNGKIYCIPNTDSRILVLDPNTNSVDTTSVTVAGISNSVDKWQSTIITPDGIIYGAPRSESRILIINTNTNTTSTISMGGLSAGYQSCALAPNGKMYCPTGPAGVGNVLVVDTKINTVTTITVSVAIGCQSACLAPNGLIYCAPYSNNRFVIINPDNDKLDTTSISSLFNRWYISGKLAPDGLMYFLPSVNSNNGEVLIVDYTTNRIDSTTIVIGNDSYISACLAPNGKFYCVSLASAISVFGTGLPKLNFDQCFCSTQNKGA